MIDPIQSGITSGPVTSVSSTVAGSDATQATGKSFMDTLLDNLDEVNRLQTEADEGVQALMTGETDNVAEVFTAVNKAGVAFDLLMEIRNKLLDAYREIQQMSR